MLELIQPFFYFKQTEINVKLWYLVLLFLFEILSSLKFGNFLQSVLPTYLLTFRFSLVKVDALRPIVQPFSGVESTHRWEPGTKTYLLLN